MPDFVKGGTVLTPFGKNAYLRSTVGCQFESYTVARRTIPLETINSVAGQQVLQPGTLMAKITSGADSGKIGPYQASGTAEVQTATKSGTVSGGSFTLSFNGATTTAIQWDAVAATVQLALEALSTIEAGDITVTGGPIASVAFTITFGGNLSGNQAQITADATLLTGSTPGITMATSVPGVAGAIDGRQTLANIVGLNDTFLAWQLMEGDREVAVMYHGTAVQSWCFELDTAGARAALNNTRADACRSVKGLDILFK